MYGIEAQPVEAVVHQPHQRVVDEEVADFAAAEIDAIAPGRLLVVAEEVFGVAAEVVAVRAEVVVDRKSVVSGKSVSVRVVLGGRRIIKKKNIQENNKE